VRPELRGLRYLTKKVEPLARFIEDHLRYLDFDEVLKWYRKVVPLLDNNGRAILGCNDRYFLLTGPLHRKDALHPWLFDRCREVESAPDGYLDLWAREHFKSSIITCAGTIQESLIDPEITIAIFSHTKPIAQAFLAQIKREFDSNEALKAIYPDVCWANPRTEAPRWSLIDGLIVKRQSNPKEATIEAHGLVDGQPTSRHFKLRVYDDVVTRESVTNPAMIRKTTEAWEMSDNLSASESPRIQMAGTRYHFGDTYGVILDESRGLKPRVYPATHDGTMNGKPVLYSQAWWDKKKRAQKSTVAAQMLLNPVAGKEAVFHGEWLRPYDVIPSLMNVYIMCDPSKGKSRAASSESDRTAIVVIGLDVMGNKYLLDGYCHRMSLSERYEKISQLRRKWMNHPGVDCVNVGYERYGMQVDTEVIQEWQQRDNDYFEITELAFPREGPHSKRDRIERLEPDIRNGAFYLPAVVWHPDMDSKYKLSLWKPWTALDHEAAERGRHKNYAIGHVVYRPMQALTKRQRLVHHSRIVTPIKRLNEDREPYDVTRVFIEEMTFFPFSPHDDLLDAASRVYDMEPKPAVKNEGTAWQSLAEDDLRYDYGEDDGGGSAYEESDTIH
jgi:hypothetical protein